MAVEIGLLLLVIYILHYLKSPKLWELWYISHNAGFVSSTVLLILLFVVVYSIPIVIVIALLVNIMCVIIPVLTYILIIRMHLLQYHCD